MMNYVKVGFMASCDQYGAKSGRPPCFSVPCKVVKISSGAMRLEFERIDVPAYNYTPVVDIHLVGVQSADIRVPITPQAANRLGKHIVKFALGGTVTMSFVWLSGIPRLDAIELSGTLYKRLCDLPPPGDSLESPQELQDQPNPAAKKRKLG